MKQFNRFLSILLALVMTLGCLSGLALTASAADYDLWVGAVQVTDANCADVLGDGTVRYDPSTHTLSLNNATVSTGYNYIQYNSQAWAFIYSTMSDALTIELTGTNLIGPPTSQEHSYYGIYKQGDLKFHGAGTLTLQNIEAYGVYTYNGSVFFDDGVNSPTLNTQSGQYGIYAKNVTLERGTLTVAVAGTGAKAGIYATQTLQIGNSQNGDVTIEASCPERYYCYPISAGSIVLSDQETIVLPIFGKLDSDYGRRCIKDDNNQVAASVRIVPSSSQEAQSLPTHYPLRVCGVRVTSANCTDILGDGGSVQFDPINTVLILNNATLTAANVGSNGNPMSFVEYIGDALTVELTGTNTLSTASVTPYFGMDINADLYIHGGGSLTVQQVNDDAICCGGMNSIRFDDAVNRPTLTLNASRYGIWGGDIFLYQAVLDVTTAGTVQGSDSYCKCAAIYAEGTMQIGDGTKTAAMNNVSLTAVCQSNAEKRYALFAKTALNIPELTATYTVPVNGTVGACTGGQTILDGGSTAYQVQLQTHPRVDHQYDLWIDGVRITEANCDQLPGMTGCSFDPTTNTLSVAGTQTLNTAAAANGVSCNIYSTLQDLYVDLADGASLTLGGCDYGVYTAANCDLHLLGGGALAVTATVAGLCCGGDLLFDGEDAAKQPDVEVTAGQNGVSASSVYLWNVDLTATVTQAPGANDDPADFAAIRATGTGEGSGVVRFGETGAAAWKNNTAVTAASPDAMGVYAPNGFSVSQSLSIRQPQACLPFSVENTTLRSAPGGSPATTVQIAPLSAQPTAYSLWVAGVQITDNTCNDILGNGSMVYVPGAAADTLYLANAVVETSSNDAYIRYAGSKPLTVVLAGQNRLGFAEDYSSRGVYGLVSETADVHIIGSGSLAVFQRSNAINCGANDLYFDDPVNRPVLNLNASISCLRARNIYIDRAELTLYCKGNNSIDYLENNICINAPLWADAVLRIGGSSGTNNVILQLTSNTLLFDSQYLSKVFGIYAGSGIVIADNEGIVTPYRGGVYNAANVHTVIAPGGETAYEIRIEPQTPPTAPAGTPYDLWINGYRVTEENKNSLDGSRFDPLTNTLYLTEDSVLLPTVVNNIGCVVYSRLSDLTVVLEEGCDAEIADAVAYGIYAETNCNLHIRGVGALQMTDVRTCGIQLNGTGDLYFDANADEPDPADEWELDERPSLKIVGKGASMCARNIFFWNVNLYADVQESDAVAIRASGAIELGSENGGKWKNNAIVYGHGSRRIPLTAATGLTVSSEEKIWLPNEGYVTHSYSGDYYYIAGSGYGYGIFITPKKVLPSGEVPIDYQLWVNGVQVTSENQDLLPGMGGSYYDPIDQALHLSGNLYLNNPGLYDAVITSRLDNLNLILDSGTASLCMEQDENGNYHQYGVYATGNLTVSGNGGLVVGGAESMAIRVNGTLSFAAPAAPVRANYDDADEYQLAYDAWQSSLYDVPVVTVYSRSYGIYANNLNLEKVRLNAIVFSSNNPVEGSLNYNGIRVKNAAIAVKSNLNLGTSSGEGFRNCVTSGGISEGGIVCNLEDGYAIYAWGSINENSAYTNIIKPVNHSLDAGSHYVVDSSGAAAKSVSIGTVTTGLHDLILTQPDEGGFLRLNGHEDLRAHAGSTITVRLEPENAYYVLGSVTITYDGVTEPAQISPDGLTASFTMPAADVTVTAVPLLTGHSVAVAETQNGAVTADRDWAAAGETVTLTVVPEAHYELDTLTFTPEGGQQVQITLTNGSYEFTMPDYPVTVNAEFRRSMYQVNVSSGNPITASVTEAGCGDTVTLTIPLSAGYALDVLTIQMEDHTPVPVASCVTNAEGTVTTATFLMPGGPVWISYTTAAIRYSITKQTSVNGTYTIGKDSATVGEYVYVNLYPDSGYELDEMTVVNLTTGEPVTQTGHVFNTNTQSYEPNYLYFVMPAADVSVSVTFRRATYTVTVAQAQFGSVQADVSTAMLGDTVTLTVTPDDQTFLLNLSYTPEGGQSVTITQTNGVYSFTMPAANVTVTPTFGLLPCAYVDAQGNSMTPVTAYSLLDADTAELTAGWWVVRNSITNNNRLTVSGEVHLILCDGATLTLPKGIAVKQNNVLTVWAQSHGSSAGSLTANSETDKAAIGGEPHAGSITINGGVITATGGMYGAGIGGGKFSQRGSVTINGGRIAATGGNYAAGIGGGANVNWAGHYGNIEYVTITGGTITAVGDRYGAGIGGGGATNGQAGGGHVTAINITGGRVSASSTNGFGIGPGCSPGGNSYMGSVESSITFGWTESTDFIQSSRNVSAEKLAFAAGKYFLIDGQNVIATTSNIQSGGKLIPKPSCFVQTSLTLQGQIGVNFYVNLYGLSQQTTRVVLTWGDKSTTVRLSELTAENGLYKVSAYVAAKEMCDTVTATLYDGEAVIDEYNFSVADYAAFALSKTAAELAALMEITTQKAEALQALCRAMLIYGAKAQRYFGYNVASLADASLGDYPFTLMAASDVPSSYAGSIPADLAAQGVSVTSTSLLLRSTTAFRLYLAVDDGVTLSVSMNGAALTPLRKGEAYYVDIDNISAKNIMDTFTVTINGVTCRFNVGDYLRPALFRGDDALKAAVTALYGYWQAADVYFDE